MKKCLRISALLLLGGFVAVVVLSWHGRYHPGLLMDVPFSQPWPFPCWRLYQEPQWNRIPDRLDLTALALDMVVWSILAAVCLLPAAVTLWRERTKTGR